MSFHGGGQGLPFPAGIPGAPTPLRVNRARSLGACFDSALVFLNVVPALTMARGMPFPRLSDTSHHPDRFGMTDEAAPRLASMQGMSLSQHRRVCAREVSRTLGDSALGTAVHVAGRCIPRRNLSAESVAKGGPRCEDPILPDVFLDWHRTPNLLERWAGRRRTNQSTLACHLCPFLLPCLTTNPLGVEISARGTTSNRVSQRRSQALGLSSAAVHTPSLRGQPTALAPAVTAATGWSLKRLGFGQSVGGCLTTHIPTIHCPPPVDVWSPPLCTTRLSAVLPTLAASLLWTSTDAQRLAPLVAQRQHTLLYNFSFPRPFRTMSACVLPPSERIHPASMVSRSEHDPEVAWFMRQRVNEGMIGKYLALASTTNWF